MFKDWDGKKSFDPKTIPLLYEDLDDASANEILLLDDEIQAIKSNLMKRFPKLTLT